MKDLPTGSPTYVRLRIVFLLMLLTYIHHFNRVGLVLAADEHIMRQYGISTTQMGTVYSAFLLTYTMCMTPGGWFIDRWGGKAGLLLMCGSSALFVALTGACGLLIQSSAVLLPVLVALRALMGALGAPMHPAAARLVSHWIPLSSRSGVNGLTISAAAVGMASIYVVFGALMDWLGWPAAFLVVAGATAVLAAVWFRVGADFPNGHAAVNSAELDLIAGFPATADKPATTAEADKPPWTDLLCNRSLMLLTVSYSAVGYFEYVFFYWMHYYFEDVLHLGKEESRSYSTICLLAMAVGMAVGGWMCDRLQALLGYRLGRRLVPALGMTSSAILLGLGIQATQPVWIVTLFAIALGMIGASEGPFFATAVELGGHRGGLSGAIANTGGNLSGVVAPILTPFISETFGWTWGLGVASVYCLMGACFWGWIDPLDGCGEQ